jgi:hypothetical protein
MVVQDVQDVCVIHNRHKGILQAIKDMKEGSHERYRAPLWPDVKSRWCTRHMKANLHNQFRTRPCLNCLSGCVSSLSKRSLMPSGRN